MYKTFSELGFKAGDKVRCIHSQLGTYEEGKTYTLAKYSQSDEVVIGGGWNGYAGDWELVEPIDMANNRVPFGLLTEEEKEVLKSWDGRFSFYSGYGLWGLIKEPTWIPHYVYRTVPKPKTIPVSDIKGTVEMKDGKPDWSTYFED